MKPVLGVRAGTATLLVACFLLLGSVVALTVQNHRLAGARPGRSRGAPLAVGSAAGLNVGQSVDAMELWSREGSPVLLAELIAERDQTLVHFLDRQCPVCVRELEAWRCLSETGEAGPIVFVACNEDSPLQSVGRLGAADSLYTQLRSAARSSRVAAVPVTIAVSREGTITGVFRFVEEVLNRHDRGSGS